MQWPSAFGPTVAAVALAAAGGFCCAYFFRSWLGRLVTPLAAGSVLVLLLVALLRGRSDLLERLTSNIAEYIATNPVGFAAFGLGLLLGSRRRGGKTVVRDDTR